MAELWTIRGRAGSKKSISEEFRLGVSYTVAALLPHAVSIFAPTFQSEKGSGPRAA
jgi:hypothetical protein